MPLWGKNDASSNAVISAAGGFDKTPNSANRDSLFGNTTVGSFVNNMAVGMFMVDGSEIHAAIGEIADVRIESGGVGYVNDTSVAITALDGGTGANVTLTTNSTGGITSLTINDDGADYNVPPTAIATSPVNNSVTIDSGGTGFDSTQNNLLSFSGGGGTGAAATFTNSGAGVINGITVSNQGNGYTSAPSVSVVSSGKVNKITISAGGTGYDSTSNNQLTLTGGGGTGAVATFANNGSGVITSITISNQGNNYTSAPAVTVTTPGGGSGANLVASVGLSANLSIALKASGANLTVLVEEGGKGVAHSGWVLRREGTGGRAGRVHYETLVAMRLPTGDASDDTILPDA